MLDPDISTADALVHLSRPETDPNVLDRRRFLQLVGMGVGAGLVAGGSSSLLDHALLGHDPSAWAAGPIGPNDGILVMICMYGGNDGLNTVVPITDGNYRTMHGSLAIPAAQTLPIDATTGLNPALTELKKFWDQGKLAIVEGLGYANPDLSHFNSMAYWMSGRPNQIPSSGWIGRWLDGYLDATKDLYAAAEIGWSVPLHLAGAVQRGTVVPTSKPSFGAGTSDREQRVYRSIRRMRSAAYGPWHGAVADSLVDQLDLAKTLNPIIPASDQLSTSEIVAKLEIAARLINANLGFRVLSVGWGDFDSHAGQPDMHTARMRELNAGIARFFQLLNAAFSTRVTLMTFSEFGRTPWDNDGAGTDHGTSAPHFVIGQNVRGGRYGQRPSLSGLERWDRMRHHVDYRSYYASLIDGWLGGGSSTVLGGSFENLRLFRYGPGKSGGGGPVLPPAVVTPRSNYVPLTPKRVADTRTGLGGVPRRPLNPEETIKVTVAGKAGVPASGATAVVANVTAVGATTPMFFTVYPGGTARPATSNLNAGPGRPVPNLVVMGIGSDGCIDVYNSHGTTHCLVDVFGYFTREAGNQFVPVTPARLFDTRNGVGVRSGPLAHLTPVDIPVAGKAGVPTSGATAVVMNLTATATQGPGFLRVTPTGSKPADTSNVNFLTGDTVPNLVICKLGAGGKITLDAAGPSTHALGDVFGYFGPSGAQLRATPPRRVLDTRTGIGSTVAPIGPSRTLKLPVGGQGSVPSDATAVVLNVTATNVAQPSFVTVWPYGQKNPGTSNLNVKPGGAIANLVICRLGAGGALSIGNVLSNCDVIADLLGYYVD